eukprot:scaffold36143_cov31-Tisochrysis_lutea.AAC.1
MDGRVSGLPPACSTSHLLVRESKLVELKARELLVGVERWSERETKGVLHAHCASSGGVSRCFPSPVGLLPDLCPLP